MDEYLLTFIRDTGEASLFETNDGNEIWLPNSQIFYYDRKTAQRGDEVSVEIPDWLAENKGLL